MWWQHGPYMMWGQGWWIFPIFGMIICLIIVFFIFRFMVAQRGGFWSQQDQSQIESLRKEIRELREEIQNLKRKDV